MTRLPCTVNHYLCPADLGLCDFLDALVRHGFSGVGLTQRALESLPLPRLQAELSGRGLSVSSLNTAGFFFDAADAGSAQAVANQHLLEAAAELAVPCLNVIVGSTTQQPLHEARRYAREQLRRLAVQASNMGVPLVLELLNPLNVRSKSCLNTLAQAHQMGAGLPGLRLNADFFHVWWDPDLEDLLRGEQAVGLLQICDVASDPQTGVARRVPLGEGFLDWQRVLTAARRQFPDAPVELELFADQLPGRPLDELLASSASQLSTYFGEQP
jgi:sugar phosphate isomerase/epimerase